MLPVLLALAGVTAIAWLYLFIARQDMDMPMAAMEGMPDMAMPFAAPWVFAMWWVMMLGMMLPSAAPMILMYATLQRRKRERDEPYVPTAMFVAGYLIVWGAFSAGSHGGAVVAAAERFAVTDAGAGKSGVGRRVVHPGRYLPVDAIQICLPAVTAVRRSPSC